jgi:hypothetical protein
VSGGVIGQPRSSQRYPGSKAIRNRRLVERDGRALAGEHPLRLQAGMDVPEAQRLAGRREAGAPAVVAEGSQCARQTTQEAAPSPGREREWMNEEVGRAQDHV